MTDQQHDRMMSCADNPWLNTPHLDGLAEEGIRFEKAYATNPVCVPSRMSMATGMMPGRFGGADNKSAGNAQLDSQLDENSMGKLMKRAGYDTFYGGKVHMCAQLSPNSAHGAGYNQYFKNSRDLLPAACLEFIKKERDTPFSRSHRLSIRTTSVLHTRHIWEINLPLRICMTRPWPCQWMSCRPFRTIMRYRRGAVCDSSESERLSDHATVNDAH